MKKKKYVIFLVCIAIYILFMIGQDRVPVEELDIVNGVGYDLKKENKEENTYSISYSTYVYKPNMEKANVVYEANALSIGEVHQNKQRRTNKKIIQGQERVILISDLYAKNGIRALIDERFRNSEFNDMAYVVVCNGKSQDYLSYNQKEYITSSEFIYGLIENATNYNFFSRDYKVVDTYVRLDSEGRSIVLPNISMEQGGIKICGSSLFNKDKLMVNIDMKKTKILNLLKYDNGRGVLSIEKNYKEFIDFYVENSDRNVTCYKNDGKYGFIISLSLNGKIGSNELYKDILHDIEVKKKFEKDMSKKVEEMCSDFIKTMQLDYKFDCLGLGREAAAVFGRKTGVDWNDVITNADIKVNVKVNVTGYGRGDY